MNHYKLSYSNESSTMIEAHVEFLSRVSVKASEKLYQEYLIGIENIKLNPYGYRYFDDRKNIEGISFIKDT